VIHIQIPPSAAKGAAIVVIGMTTRARRAVAIASDQAATVRLNVNIGAVIVVVFYVVISPVSNRR
jgi:hypothetical protein